MIVCWKYSVNAHLAGLLTHFSNLPPDSRPKSFTKYYTLNIFYCSFEQHTFKLEKKRWSCSLIHPEHKCTETQCLQNLISDEMCSWRSPCTTKRKGPGMKVSLRFDLISWIPGTLPINKLWIMQSDCVVSCTVVSLNAQIMHLEILECLKLFAFNKSGPLCTSSTNDGTQTMM